MKFALKNIILTVILTVAGGSLYFTFIFYHYQSLRWPDLAQKARADSIGFPQQFGLTNTASIRCVPIQPTGNCPNHPLCALKPNNICGQYTVITGVPAGGDGSEIILNSTQLATIKYKSGDSIIAGGLSNALLQVVAAPGGCYGCH